MLRSARYFSVRLFSLCKVLPTTESSEAMVEAESLATRPRGEKDCLLLHNQQTCSTIHGDVESALSVGHASAVTCADLSLNEKLSLLSGESMWTTASIPRLSIPSLILSDGPHGVRKQLRDHSILESFPATCFPTAAALACSWDESLLHKVGTVLQKESVHYGVHILLGPGMNLKRHPAGGRNFEYFSEDPLLTGRLAVSFVQGIQSSGTVAACVKHLAVNNQESHRFVVDAIVDERTLRELYFRGFQRVVEQAKPATIMCAYNRLNGIFCSEHSELLTNILRREWGFDGITMTDWGAANQRSAGVTAGMDLEMPGSYGAHDWEIRDALAAGDLSMSCIDASVDRVLRLAQAYGSRGDFESANTTGAYEEGNPMWEEHYKLAHSVAMDCCVLLKNDDGCLPLSADGIQKIAVVGDFARDHPRFQGMGSSQVHSVKVRSSYEELQRHGLDHDKILFAPGYHADDDHVENVDAELVAQAVGVAREAEVVLLFIGLPEIMESEGFDRRHLQLPAQHSALVEAICQVNENVVVVLSNGGVVEIPWFQQPKAILEGYLLGEAGGAAVIDLIFGVQSPCGKLAETIPECVEDILSDKYFPGTRDRVEYREGLLIGYRYFDTAKKQVQYPFGHGLSYTTFVYSDLQLSMAQDDENEKSVEVTFLLQNTGLFPGKEIVQCYVCDLESSVFRPEQELKEFAKVRLDPGESQQVRFVLNTDAFSFYDIGMKHWIVERGQFEIRIGASSRDIRLTGLATFCNGPEKASSMSVLSYPPLTSFDKVDDAEFFNRFGDSAGHTSHNRSVGCASSLKNVFNRNSLLKEAAKKTLLGYIFLSVVNGAATKDVKQGPARRRQRRMVKETVKNLPLRTLVLFSQGSMSFDTLDACISLMNWHFVNAIISFGKAVYRVIRQKR
jgi:beta-glucosidase